MKAFRKNSPMKNKICLLSISVLQTFAALTANGAVIISQYYEGASNNKWIELCNTTSVAVDLSVGDYRLGIWSNTNREGWKTGAGPTATIDLNVVIPANGTILIENSSAALPTYAVADVSSGSLTFNGDDSVVIYTAGSSYAFLNVVDAIGLTGNTAADTSFVRVSSVVSGINTDFNPAHWLVYTNAAVDSAGNGVNERLGVHAVPEPAAALLGGIGLLGLLRRRRV